MEASVDPRQELYQCCVATSHGKASTDQHLLLQVRVAFVLYGWQQWQDESYRSAMFSDRFLFVNLFGAISCSCN
jgi:hypothetical protein